MQQILRIFNILSMGFVWLTWSNHALGAKKAEVLTYEKLQLSQRVKKTLKKSPYAKSDVESYDNKLQSLDYLIVGLHKKRCSYALVKLSQYERYQEFIDFVKTSSYNAEKERIRLSLSHTLMPFDMVLDFKIKRITGPGAYPFQFDSGFLKGLKGMINVSEHRSRCLFATTAYWKGPDSGIPDSVFSFFSQALGRLAMERLFRVSETL